MCIRDSYIGSDYSEGQEAWEEYFAEHGGEAPVPNADEAAAGTETAEAPAAEVTEVAETPAVAEAAEAPAAEVTEVVEAAPEEPAEAPETAEAEISAPEDTGSQDLSE